jgi:hypothetical protein
VARIVVPENARFAAVWIEAERLAAKETRDPAQNMRILHTEPADPAHASL